MKRIFRLSLLLLVPVCSFGQKSKNLFSAGPALFAGIERPQPNNRLGVGFNVRQENRFAPRVAFTGQIGFGYLFGDVLYWKNGEPITVSNKNFSMLYGLAGLRFYASHLHAGLALGPDFVKVQDFYTNLAIVPSMGMKWQKIDITASLFGVPQLFATIPERSVLQKGGFSYLSFSVCYSLN